jgi:tRNA A-37 threonylcarbamoyl transferase component Bud32
MTRHITADLDPTSFGGRYTLLRRLAIGGMAEIYLARQAAMAGFEKEVVIKRLRAELADDPRIVEMFLDEARIGALLNHPNIVHVYDVDEHDGIPYIAMEYIIGEELNELCRRGIAHDKFLPIEHAVELIRQAAAGMGYFHATRGAEGTLLAGQPLEIVHLDISPTNLLVTQDGNMKVIDFGIANAKGQRQRTDVIPGKLGYMSPEQAGRKSVDHRSDIFSLGIVLYEITVGKRLFRGPAHEVVKRLVEAQVEPPTFARRSFPPALESIVMRTLERLPEDRYQSAYDLADDLEAFLRDERLHSGPVRIARYLDMLTQAGGGPRRPELAPEQAPNAEELDFDSQMFEAFKPAPGAPGPEQAPDWEDAEEPEADIAAALGMDLAELRALRTPVPTVPAGMAPITGRTPRVSEQLASVSTSDVNVTNPLARIEPIDAGWDSDGEPPTLEPRPIAKRAKTDEGDGDVDLDDLDDVPAKIVDSKSKPVRVRTEDEPAIDAEPRAIDQPATPVAPARAPTTLPSRPSRPSAPTLSASQSRLPVAPSSSFGERLPWILVGLLAFACLALAGYIAMSW